MHKSIYFKKAQKSPIFFGYFYTQNFRQELSNIAQSGPTVRQLGTT